MELADDHAALAPGAAEYLDLLRRCLTRVILDHDFAPAPARGAGLRGRLFSGTQRFLSRRGLAIVQLDDQSREDRIEGRGWPASAETMMGYKRLGIVQDWIVECVRRPIAGDFVDAGCWRGGGAIFMSAVLKALGQTSRRVYAADSFRGYPEPTAESGAVDRHLFQRADYYTVSRADVEANFARYGLLDSRLHILEGWFQDTLPRAPIERVAMIRADVDGYESTREILRVLYPRLSLHGYVMVDDITPPGARRAVDEYLAAAGTPEDIRPVLPNDPRSVYWRKTHS